MAMLLSAVWPVEAVSSTGAMARLKRSRTEVTMSATRMFFLSAGS